MELNYFICLLSAYYYLLCYLCSIISPKTKKLDKVGEAFMEQHNALLPPQWQMNDEKISRRQLRYVSPMFHFRHWDDYGSSGVSTVWTEEGVDGVQITDLPGCMVLHVDGNKIMKFQTCSSALASPAVASKKNLRGDKKDKKSKNSKAAK